MAESCSFSNEWIDSTEARGYQKARCPLCGAVMQLVPRANGVVVFKWHQALQADSTYKGECWQQVNDKWVWKQVAERK